MARMKTDVELEYRYKCDGRTGRPRSASAGVPHVTRPFVADRYPVHVTIRVKRHVWNLRGFRTAPLLRRIFIAAAERFDTRICHFSVQGHQLHLIVETSDRVALGRALKGLGVRIARGMNKLMGTRGAVLADRYHARILCSPVEVRGALVHVLNGARHRSEAAFGPPSDAGLTAILGGPPPMPREWMDPYSSARHFDGWSIVIEVIAPGEGRPVRAPRTWLLSTGWRSRGPIDPAEGPFARRRPTSCDAKGAPLYVSG